MYLRPSEEKALIYVTPGTRKSTWQSVTANVDLDESYNEVWYDVSQGPVSLSQDAFAAIALLPAMKFGGILKLDGGISHKLLSMIPTIQDVFLQWCPHLRRADIEAESYNPTNTQPRRIAS